MKRSLLMMAVAIAASVSFSSCNKKAEEAPVPVLAWTGIDNNATPESLKAQYQELKDHGVTGVCPGAGMNLEKIAMAAKAAKELGLTYHAWVPALPQGGKDHSWYAVNRLGESADEHPAYVAHYQFLDPANPDVINWLVEQYTAIAAIPEVDYVQLDFIRYPDVILSRGLWDKYGLDMTHEYAPADYCYCDSCVAAFKEKTGIDIKSVEDPSTVKEWAEFRCDIITNLVKKIADAVHAQGKLISADVFPGPNSHAVWMTRQQWDEWGLDAVFPMNYNDFYLEGPAWVGEMAKEEAESVPGTPVYSGLFICPDWQNKDKVTDPENSGLLPSEMEEAVVTSLEGGAAGLCLFTPDRMSPEHWQALDDAIAKFKAEKK